MNRFRTLKILTPNKKQPWSYGFSCLLVYSTLLTRPSEKWTRKNLARFLSLDRQTVARAVARLGKVGLVAGLKAEEPPDGAFIWSKRSHWAYTKGLLATAKNPLTALQNAVYSLVRSYGRLIFPAAAARQLGCDTRTARRALQVLEKHTLVERDGMAWKALSPSEEQIDWWRIKTPKKHTRLATALKSVIDQINRLRKSETSDFSAYMGPPEMIVEDIEQKAKEAGYNLGTFAELLRAETKGMLVRHAYMLLGHVPAVIREALGGSSRVDSFGLFKNKLTALAARMRAAR